MKNFIISALPRSGTAWCSELLASCEGVFCWHEAIQHGDTFTDYRQALSIPNFDFVGDSTTHAGPEFDDLSARRVWIDREENDCFDSYREVLGEMADSYRDRIINQGLTWKHKHQPEIIKFEYLFNKDEEIAWAEANKLVKACLGVNGGLNFFSWMKLRKLNIQIHGLCPEYYDGKQIINGLGS